MLLAQFAASTAWEPHSLSELNFWSDLNCGAFDHVITACTRPQLCLQCGQPYANLTVLLGILCFNCGKARVFISNLCLQWQEERSVCRCRNEHNASFSEARTGVRSSAGTTTFRPVNATTKPMVALVTVASQRSFSHLRFKNTLDKLVTSRSTG